MRVPLSSPLDNYLAHQHEIDEAVKEILRSGDYILGSEVRQFETEFASYIGVKDAIAVASGTEALALALRSLDIGPGDEVITVSHSPVAVVSAIEQIGAVPVLVDIERDYYTIDFQRVYEMTTDKTAAVISVHLYGHAADIATAIRYEDETGVPVLEDCSQAHGAVWSRKKLGSWGSLSAFSCYPTKNLGAFGDAGLVCTQDEDLGERLRRLRQYGWVEKQRSLESGINSRMDELQAAVLRVQLRTLDRRNARRREIAARYRLGLEKLPITFKAMRPQGDHVFHLFVCECASRLDLQQFLRERGVQTGIHYPYPIHKQPAFEGRLRQSRLDNTDEVAPRILSLPMFPELSDSQIDFVIETIKEFPNFY
jgi:dTDP-4-amino-4,6-dideoxygalactose transaminase